MSAPPRPIWLDCDPGHDDAIAILLASNLPEVKLLGVSTVHGNASAECTKLNAIRLLWAFGAPKGVNVWPGASHPLIRPTRADPEIHGVDGLGGVEGLPEPDDGVLREYIALSSRLKAIDGMAQAVKKSWNGGSGEKIYLIATGPLTNIALFFNVYPELLDGIQEFVFMGGGVGIGNRSSVAEFNILCDPEAAQIVLDTPVPKAMIPLNVTHTTLLTKSLHRRMLDPLAIEDLQPLPLPVATSPLRHTLSTLMSFFAESYRTTFGFEDGPPLHDALTLAYVAHPEIFKHNRYRVDCELGYGHAVGETVVDMYRYQKCDEMSWGRGSKNCLVVESVQVPKFFELFFEAIKVCEAKRL